MPDHYGGYHRTRPNKNGVIIVPYNYVFQWTEYSNSREKKYSNGVRLPAAILTEGAMSFWGVLWAECGPGSTRSEREIRSWAKSRAMEQINRMLEQFNRDEQSKAAMQRDEPSFYEPFRTRMHNRGGQRGGKIKVWHKLERDRLDLGHITRQDNMP